jgi:hypothetical protein
MDLTVILAFPVAKSSAKAAGGTAAGPENAMPATE